eukprot:4338744-Amphidinium_carterae.1
MGRTRPLLVVHQSAANKRSPPYFFHGPVISFVRLCQVVMRPSHVFMLCLWRRRVSPARTIYSGMRESLWDLDFAEHYSIVRAMHKYRSRAACSWFAQQGSGNTYACTLAMRGR